MERTLTLLAEETGSELAGRSLGLRHRTLKCLLLQAEQMARACRLLLFTRLEIWRQRGLAGAGGRERAQEQAQKLLCLRSTLLLTQQHLSIRVAK